METCWSLKLEDKAAANAKRIKREVVALNAAMRELQSLAGLTDKALRGMGGGDTSRRLRAQAGLIREQTRALREQRSTQAQRVRDDRAADRQRRRETKQQLDAHGAVARVSAQREQREARARREADGHYATFQRGERRQAREREQREANRARREAADRRMADGHFAQVQRGEQRKARVDDANRRMADGHFAAFQRGEQRAGREREQRVARQSRLDDANRRLADRHFGQVQRGERAAARDRSRGVARDARDSERYYRGIYRSQQSAQAWGRRQNERAAARHRQEGVRLDRALVRQNAQRDASPIMSALEGLIGRGGISAMGYAAAGATALMAAVYALGSAMLSITRTTFEIIGQIGGLVMEFGQLALSIGGAILQMISFRESTLMTLTTLMRVPGEERMSAQERQAARGSAAQDEFRWAQQFGRETPLSTQQVTELRTQATTAGYQGAEARTMTAAAADAGALHPNDAGTASRFMLQMGQLRNSSVARSADYRPAAMAAGVSEVAAMRRAAVAAHIVQGNDTEAAYQRRIRTAQGNGQITGRQMHDAILAEQNSQLGNRNSGDFARSKSGSMAAVLSNLGEGFQTFISSIQDIENLPGIVMLKSMLTDITSMLAGTTNNGKALQAIFAGLVNDAAMFVGTIFGDGGFDGALSSVMETVKALLPPLRAIWQGFSGGFLEGFMPFLRSLGGFSDLAGTMRELGPEAREFGRGLASIAVFMLRVSMLTTRWVARLIAAGQLLPQIEAGVRDVIQLMLHPIDFLRGRAHDAAIDAILPRGTAARAAADFFGIGQNMGQGVAAGFRSQQAFMQSEVSSVMDSLPTQARTDLQIKSPSRVMAEIGEFMAMGVTQGLDSGAGGVQSAMSNVVAPPGLPGFGGAGMGSMGAPSISIVVQVQGGASAEETGMTIGERIEEYLVGTFGRMQLAGGA